MKEALRRLIPSQSLRRDDRTPRAFGASESQKSIMLALAEGWTIQFVDNHGWCLFQRGRARPFAGVSNATVDEMTTKGWLSAGIATREQSFRPAKFLSPLGEKLARTLIESDWAMQTDWDPYQYKINADLGEASPPAADALRIKAA